MKLLKSWSSLPTMQWWRTGSTMQGITTGCCQCSVSTSPEVRAASLRWGEAPCVSTVQFGAFICSQETFPPFQFRNWRPEGWNAKEVWTFSASRYALPHLSIHSPFHGEVTLLVSTLIHTKVRRHPRKSEGSHVIFKHAFGTFPLLICLLFFPCTNSPFAFLTTF